MKRTFLLMTANESHPLMPVCLLPFNNCDTLTNMVFMHVTLLIKYNVKSSPFVIIYAMGDVFCFEKTLEPREIPQSLRNQHIFYTLTKGGGWRMSAWPINCYNVTLLFIWVPCPRERNLIRTSWAQAATGWWRRTCERTPKFCSLRPPRGPWWPLRSPCAQAWERSIHRSSKSPTSWRDPHDVRANTAAEFDACESISFLIKGANVTHRHI